MSKETRNVLIGVVVGTFLGLLTFAIVGAIEDNASSKTSAKVVSVSNDAEVQALQVKVDATEATGIKGRNCVMAMSAASQKLLDGKAVEASFDMAKVQASCQEFSDEVKQFESYKP